jgi:hypothetical protein
MLDMAHNLRHRRTSDPRDRFFAVRGLMEDLQPGDFEPDYSESVEETYERFTKSMSVNEGRPFWASSDERVDCEASLLVDSLSTPTPLTLYPPALKVSASKIGVGGEWKVSLSIDLTLL